LGPRHSKGKTLGFLFFLDSWWAGSRLTRKPLRRFAARERYFPKVIGIFAILQLSEKPQPLLDLPEWASNNRVAFGGVPGRREMAERLEELRV
jgi:hypothetical protein